MRLFHFRQNRWLMLKKANVHIFYSVLRKIRVFQFAILVLLLLDIHYHWLYLIVIHINFWSLRRVVNLIGQIFYPTLCQQNLFFNSRVIHWMLTFIRQYLLSLRCSISSFSLFCQFCWSLKYFFNFSLFVS